MPPSSAATRSSSAPTASRSRATSASSALLSRSSSASPMRPVISPDSSARVRVLWLTPSSSAASILPSCRTRSRRNSLSLSRRSLSASTLPLPSTSRSFMVAPPRSHVL